MTTPLTKLIAENKESNPRLALVAEVAIASLERMRNENSDPYGIAKYALHITTAIAEGADDKSRSDLF